MKQLLTYVSGPYSSDTEEGKLLNTQKAIDVGLALMQKGHLAVIPHLSHYADMRAQGIGIEIPWEMWMEQDLAILEGCNAFFFIGPSKGACIELERAKELGLKIYHSLDEVPHLTYLKEKELEVNVPDREYFDKRYSLEVSE